jgi:hypothetical protein
VPIAIVSKQWSVDNDGEVIRIDDLFEEVEGENG